MNNIGRKAALNKLLIDSPAAGAGSKKDDKVDRL